MARDNLAALAEPLTAEETSLLDADRHAERAQPSNEPEPAPDALANDAPAPDEAKTDAALNEADQPEPEIDPATGKQRKVDYGALHAEREKRRAAEAREREGSQKLATLMGRFDVLQQLAQQKQAPQDKSEPPIEVPDINVDPVGHFAAKDAIREKEMSELRAWKQNQDQQAQVRNNVARIQELAQAHETEFSKTTPDYNEAFQYLRANRDMELQAMGYSDPGMRQQIIQNDAIQIAAQALQGQRNAAEAVYNIAKARGYTAKAPTPAPTPKPAEPHPDTVKLETVAKGQKTAGSLGQVNGSAPAETSVKAILDMSDEDFAAKFAGADGEANWRKLMGA